MIKKSIFGKILLGAAVVFLIWFTYIRFSSPPVATGTAPEIVTTMYNGESFKLSELRGNYVLLDFWGSWCGPCRRENPELVKFYKRNKNKVVIVSVALETNPDNWTAARERDGLIWEHHIVQKNGISGSSIANAYGVTSIPAKFLIDPDGNIVSSGSLDEMESIIR